MSLVIKIENTTATAADTVPASSTLYFQMNDKAYVTVGSDGVIDSATVGTQVYDDAALKIKVGKLGRHGNFDELLSN